MKIEINNLITPANYGILNSLGRSTVYKYIKEGKLKTVSIDGVLFIDMKGK